MEPMDGFILDKCHRDSGQMALGVDMQYSDDVIKDLAAVWQPALSALSFILQK